MRYTITQTAPATAILALLVGILSVGEATPGIFELHAAAPELVRESGQYAIRIRAIHPVTGRPVAGVAVQASFDLDTNNQKPLVTKTAFTDRRGFATLPFTLPQSVETDEVDVKVTGKLASYSVEADDTVRVVHYSRASISTDKPIYQPGQALHMRLMAFDTNNKAIEGEPVILKLLDPEETLVYRAQVETSAFVSLPPIGKSPITCGSALIAFKPPSAKAATKTLALPRPSKSVGTSFRLSP